jgi:hypothetical protein
VAFAIVIVACVFFFIPTTLIVLGYYASQPTGTLISPLPQGVLSSTQPTPQVTPTSSAPVVTTNAPIVAAANDSTQSASTSVVPESKNNIIDKTASISAGLTEAIINDSDVKATSQIYLSPRPNDKDVYSVKNKTERQLTISVNQSSDTVRYVDYHIVNP